MGLNAASVHVRVGSGPEGRRVAAAAVRAVLEAGGYFEARAARGAERTLILHASSSGDWTTVFDSEPAELDAFAALLSRETSAEAVCSSIQQSDAMRLALFRGGCAVDILASQGSRCVGRPELWAGLLAPRFSPDDLLEALERPTIFAEDKLVALAGLLGLNRDLCLAHIDELLDAPGRKAGARLHFRRPQLATA